MHGGSDLCESVDSENNRFVMHVQPTDDLFNSNDTPSPQSPEYHHSNGKNGNTQDVFTDCQVSAPGDDDDDDDHEAARLQSYMQKRGRRRPSQDFLDSRHLLPWQRFNKESKKYASVKFIIPEKPRPENVSNNNNEDVKYPFEMVPSTQSSLSSSMSESSLPSITSSLTLNLSKSPSPAFSSASESDGPDKSSRSEASVSPRATLPVETDNVDSKSFREPPGKIYSMKSGLSEQTTSSIAHHVPKHSNLTSYHGDSTDVRQTLSDKYYQRRRSHQTPGSYERSQRRDLPLGYSKPKGFQALKGIFENESGEGISQSILNQLFN